MKGGFAFDPELHVQKDILLWSAMSLRRAGQKNIDFDNNRLSNEYRSSCMELRTSWERAVVYEFEHKNSCFSWWFC